MRLGACLQVSELEIIDMTEKLLTSSDVWVGGWVYIIHTQ